MSSRTKARKLAVDSVFAADLRAMRPTELLEATAQQQQDRQNQSEIVGYARQLVEGVEAHSMEIDDRISSTSHQWSLERMPAVDRAILRVGCWEVLFSEDVPDAVAIAEAVELAKELSTDDSGSFVNGVLGAIAATKSAR